MEDSANNLLYTGTYVIIFIIAVSLSITLFYSVNKYADSAFNYQQDLQSSIINTQPTGNETNGIVTLSQDDVVAYYFNYIKKDIYSSQNSGNNDVKYNVTIDVISNPNDTANAIKEIYTHTAYYLKYTGNSLNSNNVKEVNIAITSSI